MSPEKLDAMIFAALSEGACALPELARRVDHDAREVLRRLHALGGQRQVGTQLANGSVEWFSRRADAPATGKAAAPAAKSPSPLDQINRAAVNRRAPRAANPATAPENKPVTSTESRKKPKPIIVRERKRVTELRVTPINAGDVIIQAEPEEAGDVPDEVFVPAADIPALIRALTELLAQ